MEDWILEQEIFFRLGIFFGLFLFFVLWEIFYPDHSSSYSKKLRWPSNLGLILFNSVIMRFAFPVTVIGVAEFAATKQIGFLRFWTIPNWASVILGLIFLDFIIYLQHVLFHSVPALWRFHRMHHADLDLDITSGTRFHTIEIMISMLIKLSAIVLSGASPITVLIFEVVLNGMAMFNHSNIFIPKSIDRILRYILITPSLHRIHHSVILAEQKSNFGFNLSIWDRLIGNLKTEAEGKTSFGLRILRNLKYLRLDWMLLIPFLKSEKE
jgi:sterol desaturase/sphingolipid hydroxylase (fatty acid hydroxylase superfamily)